MYFNPYAKDLTRKPYLHNGILLYHNNRLIERYQYPLGQLLEEIDVEENPIKNMPEIFGYMEVPDNFSTNTYRTVSMRIYRVSFMGLPLRSISRG